MWLVVYLRINNFRSYPNARKRLFLDFLSKIHYNLPTMAASQEDSPVCWRRDILTGGVEELFGPRDEIVPHGNGSFSRFFWSNMVDEGLVRLMVYRSSVYDSPVSLLKVYRFTAEGRDGNVVTWRNNGPEPIANAVDMQRFLGEGIEFAKAFRKYVQEQYNPGILQPEFVNVLAILREKIEATREIYLQPDVLTAFAGELDELTPPVV